MVVIPLKDCIIFWHVAEFADIPANILLEALQQCVRFSPLKIKNINFLILN